MVVTFVVVVMVECPIAVSAVGSQAAHDCSGASGQSVMMYPADTWGERTVEDIGFKGHGA